MADTLRERRRASEREIMRRHKNFGTFPHRTRISYTMPVFCHLAGVQRPCRSTQHIITQCTSYDARTQRTYYMNATTVHSCVIFIQNIFFDNILWSLTVLWLGYRARSHSGSWALPHSALTNVRVRYRCTILQPIFCSRVAVAVVGAAIFGLHVRRTLWSQFA